MDTPGPNLEWDTSDISQGILRVKTSLAIASVPDQETVSCMVHSLESTTIEKFTYAYKDVSEKVKSLASTYKIVFVHVQFLKGMETIKIIR